MAKRRITKGLWKVSLSQILLRKTSQTLEPLGDIALVTSDNDG